MRTRRYPVVFFLVIFWAISARAAQVGPDTFEDVPRIVAVGDVHGAYTNFVAVLTAAGLVNRELHWTGIYRLLVIAPEREANRRTDFAHALSAKFSEAAPQPVLPNRDEVVEVYGAQLFHPVIGPQGDFGRDPAQG